MIVGHVWPWHEPAPAWFRSPVLVGAVYASVLSFRFMAYLALCLRRARDLHHRYGTWAIVTGPTSGIGRSMAMELARRGLNLVLVGRNADYLRETSDAIRSRHGVETKTVLFDLSLVGTAQGDEAMHRLRDSVDGLDVGVLVNNAGVEKPHGMYLHEVDVDLWVRMIRVNLWAVTEVTAAVHGAGDGGTRGRGAVVNIGSAASEAVSSFPPSTMYAATKRYVAHFSRSLYVECKSKGVDVQCQAPFFVATRMVTGIKLLSWLAPFVLTADAYAHAAALWIGHGPLCFPTVRHQLLWCIAAIVPDVALEWLLVYGMPTAEGSLPEGQSVEGSIGV
ncbi:hypothetical protein EJB05_45162, partial [Eragrostis curvula]